MSRNATSSSATPAAKSMQVGLWIARAFFFIAFTVFGYMKLFMQIDQSASMWVSSKFQAASAFSCLPSRASYLG
ncbi:hypothetical protein [Pararhizobium sp. LjRoot238]|uniref:hypothetical protein n=1 Tax=Pararhizobium sp. LjRoot238 TaxID=3342293 RepID=UPI003F4F7B4F